MTKTWLNQCEQTSYELNLFRERRIAERRKQARTTPDRRKTKAKGENSPAEEKYPRHMH